MLAVVQRVVLDGRFGQVDDKRGLPSGWPGEPGAGSRVPPAELHQRLAEGASLIIDQIDHLHEPIGDLAAELKGWLRAPVQVNLYASWTATEGFGTHWDDHDVIVVQVEGAKRWRLFGPTRHMPLHRDVADPEPPPDDPVAELVMRPGDALYLPRGWWHAVTADQDTHSLHLTCGITPPHTGSRLLDWLADELLASETFRVDLPLHAGQAAQAQFLAVLGKEVATALEDPHLLERYAAAQDAADIGRLRPSLPHLATVAADAGLRVWLTTGQAWATAVTVDGEVTRAPAISPATLRTVIDVLAAPPLTTTPSAWRPRSCARPTRSAAPFTARKSGAGMAAPSATAPTTPSTARPGCACCPCPSRKPAGSSGRAPSGPTPRCPQTHAPRPARPRRRRVRLPHRTDRLRRRTRTVPRSSPAPGAQPGRRMVRHDPHHSVDHRCHSHRPHGRTTGMDLPRRPRVHRPTGTPDPALGLRTRRLPRRQPHPGRHPPRLGRLGPHAPRLRHRHALHLRPTRPGHCRAHPQGVCPAPGQRRRRDSPPRGLCGAAAVRIPWRPP
ncbi:hypothetical protein C0Q63_31745 [Streptomyces albidoflavus]|nr:hypothetical protein C0Q63_31745 [Streptomyces albidoflavus]